MANPVSVAAIGNLDHEVLATSFYSHVSRLACLQLASTFREDFRLCDKRAALKQDIWHDARLLSKCRVPQGQSFRIYFVCTLDGFLDKSRISLSMPSLGLL